MRADNGERPAIRLVRADHGDSGFAYRLDGGDVVIEAGNAQAMSYAVYDWLERVVGCRYYSRSYEYIPFDANLEVEFDDYEFSPILGYREILYTEYGDPIFAEKHKITPTCSGARTGGSGVTRSTRSARRTNISTSTPSISRCETASVSARTHSSVFRIRMCSR